MVLRSFGCAQDDILLCRPHEGGWEESVLVILPLYTESEGVPIFRLLRASEIAVKIGMTERLFSMLWQRELQQSLFLCVRRRCRRLGTVVRPALRGRSLGTFP